MKIKTCVFLWVILSSVPTFGAVVPGTDSLGRPCSVEIIALRPENPDRFATIQISYRRGEVVLNALHPGPSEEAPPYADFERDLTWVTANKAGDILVSESIRFSPELFVLEYQISIFERRNSGSVVPNPRTVVAQCRLDGVALDTQDCVAADGERAPCYGDHATARKLCEQAGFHYARAPRSSGAGGRDRDGSSRRYVGWSGFQWKARSGSFDSALEEVRCL